jgi:hypothetical protein
MTSVRLFVLLLLGLLLIYGAMATVSVRVYQAENTPAVVIQTAAVHGIQCTKGSQWPRCYSTTNGVPDHDHR